MHRSRSKNTELRRVVAVGIRKGWSRFVRATEG